MDTISACSASISILFSLFYLAVSCFQIWYPRFCGYHCFSVFLFYYELWWNFVMSRTIKIENIKIEINLDIFRYSKEKPTDFVISEVVIIKNFSIIFIEQTNLTSIKQFYREDFSFSAISLPKSWWKVAIF